MYVFFKKHVRLFRKTRTCFSETFRVVYWQTIKNNNKM